MPNLSGERKKLNLENTRAAKPKENRKDSPSSGSKAKTKTKYQDPDNDNDEYFDGEVEDGEDEIIAASVRNSKDKSTSTVKFVFCGIALVLVIIVLFLFFGRGFSRGADEQPTNDPTQQQQNQNQSQQTQQTKPVEDQQDANNSQGNNTTIGTQNFLQDTTMSNDSQLTDPDNYIKDIFGLTLRVDYEVDDIYSVADFVSYTKNRGTWGGGLELYWLDVEYKGSKYVVQVPFKYYKELDDIGIVPVKMEVLKIKDSSLTSNSLTVISYMCLDEETLKQVLKSQSKN